MRRQCNFIDAVKRESRVGDGRFFNQLIEDNVIYCEIRFAPFTYRKRFKFKRSS